MLLIPETLPQDKTTELNSRADQIQAQRQEKANYLKPDEPTKIEKRFSQLETFIRRSPIKAAVGGLAPGAGLALGSTLVLHNSDRVVSELWGGVSVRKFYTVGTGVELPNVTSHGVNLALEASHSDAPQLDYYGSGPNSSESNRTDYRREDTLFELRAGLRAHHHVTPECGIGELLLNVGPGTSDSIPSTESVFGPAEAPGVNVQSNYLLAGCSAQLDLRDLPGDPHSGTYAAAGYWRYLAQDFDPFSFNRFVATAEQYIPFFNKKRVIALRGITELNFHDEDEVVPFYMQARLGSDDTLRGFHRNRFYDDNSISFNAEYRWEIFFGFDMALFADAGKVFHRPGEISLTNLETDAGFGLRFKDRSSVLARVDVGFSREGFQVWLKFGKLFSWPR
jgi:Omp85 superfamily domain